MQKNFDTKFNEFSSFYPQLAILKNECFAAISLIAETYQKSGTLFTCGNGGSAADSEHIAGELLKGFLSNRPIDSSEYQYLVTQLGTERAEIYKQQLQRGIRCISLMGHPAFSTAFANDKNPEFTLAQKLFVLGREGDTLLAISTSGNSKNVLYAAEIAKAKNIKVIGLTGRSGGKLSELCNVCIKSPFDTVHRVQETHLPIYHLICDALESYLF